MSLMDLAVPSEAVFGPTEIHDFEPLIINHQLKLVGGLEHVLFFHSFGNGITSQLTNSLHHFSEG